MALLIGAVMLCGLLAYLLAGGSSPARAMRLRGTSAQLVAQAQYIRQQIARCAAEWPDGDNATVYHPAYPAATTAVSVTTLTCPGSSTNVWAGTDGALAPTPPTGMGAWMYLNTATAQISIKTSNATEWGSALSSAAAAIGTSEAATSGTPVDTLTVKIVQ